MDDIRTLYQNSGELENLNSFFIPHQHMYKTFTGFLDDKTDMPGILRRLEAQKSNKKQTEFHSTQIERFEGKIKIQQHLTIRKYFPIPSEPTLTNQSQYITPFSVDIWPIIGKILTNLTAEKFSLLLDFDGSITREAIIQQQTRIQTEILSRNWSFFIEDLKFLQKRTSLTSFASLVPNEEFKTKSLHFFLAFLNDTRVAIIKEIIEIKYYQ